MPRSLRIQLEEAVYYVTTEGPYQGKIFNERADYQKYLELLSDSQKTCPFKLLAYALLPDRIHLLIEANNEKASISHIMQKITPRYTKYFNHRYQRKGPLFRKRFRSVLVEKETCLDPVTRYIHLSPLRSGVVESLGDHPYTSHETFTRFGFDQDLSSSDSRDEEEQQWLDKKLSRGMVLGSEEFVAKVREKLKETVPQEPALPSQPWKSLAVLSGVFALALGATSLVFFIATRSLSGPDAVPSLKMEGMKLTGPLDEIKRLLSEAANLDGTVWDVELIQVSAEGQKQRIEDRIKFNGTNFESYYFSSQGFPSSNYTVTIHKDGQITWQATQRNSKGEIVSWRGDWQGNKMVGNLSYRPVGQNPQDFSFDSRGVIG